MDYLGFGVFWGFLHVIPLVSQQGIVTTRPEEELERLTKKLVYDMNHPPSEDYFGTVSKTRDTSEAAF